MRAQARKVTAADRAKARQRIEAVDRKLQAGTLAIRQPVKTRYRQADATPERP